MSEKEEITARALGTLGARMDELEKNWEPQQIALGTLRDEVLLEINSVDQRLHDSLESVDIEALEKTTSDCKTALESAKEFLMIAAEGRDGLITEIAKELRVGLDEQVCEILAQIRLEALRQTKALAERISTIENQNKAEINNTIKDVLTDHLKAGKLIDIARGPSLSSYPKRPESIS